MKWNEDKGWGFLEATAPCPKDYWAEYRELDKTPLGRVLTALRCAMACDVDELNSILVDVGIGGGAFVSAIECMGVDVDPQATAWLQERGVEWERDMSVDVMTFWDSFEHITNPGEYLAKARNWVLLSTPIYRDEAHALSSKHYKPNEHLWYFTDHGIKMFMREYGFKCVHQNNLETDAGREGIGSYAFNRRP